MQKKLTELEEKFERLLVIIQFVATETDLNKRSFIACDAIQNIEDNFCLTNAKRKFTRLGLKE